MNEKFRQFLVGQEQDDMTRQGGLVQGYNQGYNLNYENPTNTVGTRIGQALGSVGRLVDSPLGRGLIAYGLSNAMGDDNPLEQALTAGVGRYNAQTADKVYRNQLRNLGMSEQELGNIRGNITNEVYKNISDSYKARWNKANWGDLATISPVVAEAVKLNPELANSYLPASVAKEIMRGDLTEAQIANLLARTEKTKKETTLMGQPKPKTVIEHISTTKNETPTATGGGRPRVSTQYTQDEVQAELKRRGLI